MCMTDAWQYDKDVHEDEITINDVRWLWPNDNGMSINNDVMNAYTGSMNDMACMCMNINNEMTNTCIGTNNDVASTFNDLVHNVTLAC